MKTLYSIDSKGKTRIWRQEIQGNKYRTISGLKDGNLVTSEWTICEGKNIGKSNETSPEEQAKLEVAAKYEKQLKSGYGTSEAEAAKGTVYVEPQLAKLYEDYQGKIDFDKESWLIQCKFNGNRCIATKNGLFTRKGEQYKSIPHIEESLVSFFKSHPDAVIDGELYNYELRNQLNELSKLVRRTVHITEEHLIESEKKVRFYVYDGYNFTSETAQDKPYSVRKDWIDKNLLICKYIKEVKSYPVKSQKDLDKYYNQFLDDGQEGAILRRSDVGYENKRTKFLLKIKPENDSEGIILDIQEGQGNWAGAGKIITLRWNNIEFNATLKGTYEQGVEFLKNKKQWIGKEVKFLYNGLTGLNVPNFARVDYENCDSRK